MDEAEVVNKDEIMCPYCGHEFRDSWDYNCDGGAAENEGRGKE